MKIYIAGKITGLENFKSAFDKAEEKLKLEGNVVLNPSILPGGFEWDEYMHICFSMIDVCDAIYMLSNWEDSCGAREENIYAKAKGKIILFESEV